MLQKAISLTFNRRKTPFPTKLPVALTDEFYLDKMKISQWNAFLRKIVPEKSPNSLEDASLRIRRFLTPVFQPLGIHPNTWKAAEGWQ